MAIVISLILFSSFSFSVTFEEVEKTKSHYELFDRGLALKQKDMPEGVPLALISPEKPSLEKLPDALIKNASFIAPFISDISLPELKKLAKRLRHEGFMKPLPPSKCLFYEGSMRMDRAMVLQKLLCKNVLTIKEKHAVMHELYIGLPEAMDEEFLKVSEFKNFKEDLSGSDIAKRMERLVFFGKNDEALKTYQEYENSKFSLPDRCEIKYQKAKALKNLRKRLDAQKEFEDLAKNCPDETKIKARYMFLIIAAMLDQKDAISKFDSFVKDYKDHSFSDDVLYFKSSISDRAENLKRILKEYPRGDMAPRALFNLAMISAKEKNTDAALKYLIELKKNPSFATQAEYWIARISLFPEIFDLKNSTKSEEALKALKNLAAKSYGDYYSLLASELLEHMHEKISFKNNSKKEGFKGELPIDGELSIALELIKNGFRDDALRQLSGVHIDFGNIDTVKKIAVLYYMANRPELAFNRLRCDPGLMKMSDFAPKIYANILYPSPLNEEISYVSARYDMPKALLYGLIRQESGFLPEVRSWAGALGLAQLMPANAKSQAKMMGLKEVTIEELLEPKLNLMLGANSLFRDWHSTGHVIYAIASYNASSKNVSSWRKRNSKLMPIDIFVEDIPFKETREYVKNVLGAAFNYFKSSDGDHGFLKFSMICKASD